MLLSPVTAGFRRLAHLREARAFHPVGRVGWGRLVVDGSGSALGRALGQGEHSVTVRLSRAVGLPAASPDFLGIALRIEHARESDEPVDLLLTTTARPGWARWLVLPARRWTSRPFSTVMPYAATDGSTLLVLMPVRDWAADASPAALDEVTRERPLAFDVLESQGGWRAVGRLEVDGFGEDGSIAFDPMLNAARGLRPVRPLSGLREAAYRGSRAGRPEA